MSTNPAKGGVTLPRQIEHIAIDALIPYARNARTHSDAQVAQLAASMREFGWTNPVLIDEAGGIIAGHGRIRAAQALGMASAPCIRLTGYTEAQKRALVLADNKLAENAGWDEALLAEELHLLLSAGFDPLLTGFGDAEIQELLRPDPTETGADPDACPGMDDGRGVTALGDAWQMGAHRLVCGDCTDTGALAKLMRGERAAIVWTDPPYNVAYGGKAEMLQDYDKGHRNTSRILNDDMDDASFRAFLAAFYRAVWSVMAEGAAIYVAHSETERANFTSEYLRAGFKLSGVVIWRKNQLVLGRSDYQWIHEPILYGWKPGAAHRWYGGRKKTTVAQLGETSPFVQRADGRWELHFGVGVFVVDGAAEIEELLTSVIVEEKPRRNDLHPTMKPVALIEAQLRNHIRKGDIVADLFGGSGSTLIAAERLGARAHLCELSPAFCDVIVRRWQQYTGGTATLDGDGRIFAEIEQARGA